jgi:hypothetical protein
MENSTNFINKLNKINFTEKDGDKYTSENGFVFTWHVDYSGLRNLPIQLVVNLHYNGGRVAFWGCIDNDDTKAFADFIVKTEAKIYHYEHQQDNKNKLIGQAIFDNL